MRQAAILAAAFAALTATAQDFDVLVRNGLLVDGTGAPPRRVDVAIRGDRIVSVGVLPDATAARLIDASGLIVAPGFIDGHSHAGPALARAGESAAVPLLVQGVTTVFVNPDGGGPVDLAAQQRAVQAQRPGVNVAQLIGHNSVRLQVLGHESRAPTAAELERMRELVRAGFRDGAFGLSAGPFYAPGSFSQTEEHIAVARVAADFDGFYTSHIRDESDYTIGVVAAVDEVIRIARDARVTGIITHIKVLGPRVWGLSAEIIKRVGAARAAGVAVFADQYPYEASSTSLTAALLPAWVQEGGPAAMQGRLRDPALRSRIEAGMRENLQRRAGAANIQIRSYRREPALEGRRLDAIARDRGVDPIDAAIELIQNGGASIVSFNMDEADIRAFMIQPWVMTCSDGDLVAMGEGVPHPRSYGAYPRKLRRYVYEEKVLSLEQAVHSMTGQPAAVFGVADRGVVRPGAFADVVVFDLAAVRDRATYEQPHQLSEGMHHVFVNGRPAILDGRVTAERSGRVLRRRP